MFLLRGMAAGKDFAWLVPRQDTTCTVRQLAPLFESREAPWPEDEFEALQVRGTQLKLLLPEEPQPGRRGLLAVAMGLSLHADTWVCQGASAPHRAPRGTLSCAVFGPSFILTVWATISVPATSD
jgi:hypothetical protein